MNLPRPLDDAMIKPYQMYVDGRWKDASTGERFDSLNPYTQQPWASVPQAGEQDIRDAVAAARRAFEGGWGQSAGLQRARLMLRLADILERDAKPLSLIETTDNGKVIRETGGQMLFAARQFRYFAGFADKLRGASIPLDSAEVFDYTLREPYGVIGILTAWNSPISLLSNKLPAALAAGNCVVIKPSEHASVSTLEFCRMVEEAGFPPGVINVITGDGRVGKAMVELGGFDKISFTGSPGVGRQVAAAAAMNLTPSILELGGKSPNIVFDDADLSKAVVGALAGIFAASGQTCIAGSRLLVQRGVYATMVEQLVARANSIVMGDPADPATEMGPAANKPQFDRILQAIDAAKKGGARLVAGGGRASGEALKNGLFIEPTIFADVRNDMDLAQQEIFGPVLAIIPFDTEREAVAMANGTPYSLAAGVWTRDLSRSMRMVRAINAGVVWINTYRMVSTQAPFGGRKESGFGRERGEEGLAEFTTTKNVMIDFSDEVRDPFATKT
ncbi:MAG: aldehyde dehydrogenase [Burkholderiaceae bacterium]|nr:aldehyde dehydrogenase [Burkholderiaceae bacterium]MDP1969242.1 aldehyde dehydrogenase [Burkholderiaceae bacterium]